jgi:hypothetical protein
MATLRLTAWEAKGENGLIQTVLMKDVFQPERAPIGSAIEAERVFRGYVERVKATGKGATVSASLCRGDRAPPGFKKLRLIEHVNV